MGQTMSYKALHKKMRIIFSNIYFVKLAQIIYKHYTSLHEWGLETSNMLI